MKLLTTFSLALVFVFGAAGASAGGKYKHDKDWHVSVHHNYYGGHKYDRHHRHYRYKKHHYNHRYRHRHHLRHHYRHYDYPNRRGGYWRYRRHGHYYPYVGAAIVGSIIGHSAYHLHGDNVCYDDHGRDRRGDRHGGYSEVVGCHRIERLPDGRERRVDVPLSECY